jgi:hypothetical protein
MDNHPDTVDQQPEWIVLWRSRKAEIERTERARAVPLSKRIASAIDRIEAHRAAKRSWV